MHIEERTVEGAMAGEGCCHAFTLYLQLINCNPTVPGKSLQHRHQKLEAARPMPNQEHHADKVEYSHEYTGHVEELKICAVSRGEETNLKIIDGDPTVCGESLEHWN